MATKTFKIGEYAKGGIIKVNADKKSINIRVIDMFLDNKEIASKKGVIGEHHFINCDNLERDLNNFLHDITTSYYTGKIMAWLKEKTGINFFWC